MDLLIGIDIGTSSTKAIVTDESGREITSASASYSINTPKPLWAECDAQIWLNAVLNVMKDLSKKVDTSEVRAIAISGLYGGAGVPLDSEMNPVYPTLIWMDKRAIEQTEWVKINIGVEKLFEITGNTVDPYFGFTKMMWIHDNEPDIWKKIALFLPPKDYVIYKLTGEISTDFSSAGNIGGIFDLRKRNWSEEMLKALGISQEKLPEKILPSEAIAGYLSEEIAKETGFKSGIPVVSGGVDAAVATLASGVCDEGENTAMIGTSMCWGTIHNGNHLDWHFVNFPYVVNGKERVYSFGGATTAGAIIEWFRTLYKERNLSHLEAMARHITPGAEGITVLPFFMGERAPLWDMDIRGCIYGLSLSHGEAHLYRAFLESIAYVLKLNMKAAEKAKIPVNPCTMVVGGISKSSLWLEIAASVLEREIRSFAISSDAPYGDCFLAGLAIGLFNDMKEIKNWLPDGKKTQPIKDWGSIYKDAFARFESLYRGIKAGGL
ncbi:FGGY-family carbohydrate kinase [Kosmotoga arenicorallina]|uniref:FGGY-family carbohydrate kinase n=1 Tax=Kosmotoga arenicorallina TaxID=688066 RepID=UPI0008328570|nr:FGGY family carbohydrate kinase [Kosmotoga arenicorallina]